MQCQMESKTSDTRTVCLKVATHARVIGPAKAEIGHCLRCFLQYWIFFKGKSLEPWIKDLSWRKL